MEGVVGGRERRSTEISEVYHHHHHHHGSIVSSAASSMGSRRVSLVSEADWLSETSEHPDPEAACNETTGLLHEKHSRLNGSIRVSKRPMSSSSSACHAATSFLAEVPAILVTLLINFMTAIPFGVSYFPLGWSNDLDDDDHAQDDGSGVRGPFPIAGKEALGIRMFLLTTLVGQISLALFSKFSSPVACQLVENVPFYHAMAAIVIREQGYGREALSTLFVVFGLSSWTTGLFFLGLGKAGMGKVVHYFPSQVLVGFIGGIGVFIAISSVGVLTGEELRVSAEGLEQLAEDFELLAPTLAFEVVLRILLVVLVDADGKPKYSLLAPFYFLSIVPVFRLGLWVAGISMEQATEKGYFFASPQDTSAGATEALSASEDDGFWPNLWQTLVGDEHVWDVFTVVDFRTVSWKAVAQTLPTIFGVSCFSVINVPINIPAFANTCKVDVDMDNELVCHGYSNLLAGLLGGIQNVMTYSISTLFYKSGGRSKAAQWALIGGTAWAFGKGVAIIPYIPRCMAGTLLLHIGVDLFLEGIVDSVGEYDWIEYGGILVIAVVMTVLGMTPALIAGILVAMTTYALQSVQHLDPIFNITTAATLRSSAWTRPPEAMAVLDASATGRARILVIQLQGNLFFGNLVDMGDAIKAALAKEKPLIVILDFTLVVGMDTSAAQSVNKLKNEMNETYGIATNIFVMGQHRGYFPCEYGLSKAILGGEQTSQSSRSSSQDSSSTAAATAVDGSVSSSTGSKLLTVNRTPRPFCDVTAIPKNQVCVDFDEALVFAEDILIAFEDPEILTKENNFKDPLEQKCENENEGLTPEEESHLATHYLQNLIRPVVASASSSSLTTYDNTDDAVRFLSYFKREVYTKSQVVWNRGDKSDSAKLVLSGTLVASLVEGACGFREEIPKGCVIGELGLLENVDRFSDVICESDRSILYSLDRASWEKLVREDPALARILDHIAIRYLSHRVQHVSNRIYETRCLPV